MIHKSGTVDKVARHGKAFTLIEDGSTIWYTAFAASQLGGCASGDSVEFVFQEKVSGGTTFNNIKNDVRVVGKGSGSPAPTGVVLGTASIPTAVFGAMSLSKDRSIARQNACNVAANVLQNAIYRVDTTVDGEETSPIDADKIAKYVLDIARQIEAYTTGDLDKSEALASIEGEEYAE